MQYTNVTANGKYIIIVIAYHIAGKFGGESLANLENCVWFDKPKSSELVLIINNLLADLLIHQIFFTKFLKSHQICLANFPAIWYLVL